jgi:hypothetical protein
MEVSALSLVPYFFFLITFRGGGFRRGDAFLVAAFFAAFRGGDVGLGIGHPPFFISFGGGGFNGGGFGGVCLCRFI